LYNTLDCSTIESKSKEIIRLVQKIQKCPDGIIEFKGRLLLIDAYMEFILDLKNKYMGDLIDVSLTKGKPILFSPILNFQNDRKRIKKDNNRTVGENILSHLHEIQFYLEHPGHFANKYYPSTIPYNKSILSNNNHYIDPTSITGVLDQISQLSNSISLTFIKNDIFSLLSD
jgi:pseudo-rSAM protein